MHGEPEEAASIIAQASAQIGGQRGWTPRLQQELDALHADLSDPPGAPQKYAPQKYAPQKYAPQGTPPQATDPTTSLKHKETP